MHTIKKIKAALASLKSNKLGEYYSRLTSNSKISGAGKHLATKDPHADREAQRYDNPIASRELISQVIAKAKRPLAQEDIAETLSITDETGLEALRRRLRAMVRDGQLLNDRRRNYLLASEAEMVKCTIIAHRDGFGFAKPVDADDGEDLFLNPREMKTVLHGDVVSVKVTHVDKRGRREGTVVEVLERANTRVVGRFYIERGVCFVAANDKRMVRDILVKPDAVADAKPDDIVVVDITEQPTRRSPPAGKIVEVMGQEMNPGMEIEVAIKSHDIPHTWGDGVVEQAEAYGAEVPEAIAVKRLDLRDLPLVTIDGEDARDFDDAVFCEQRGNSWRLVVAIADVSSYVTPQSALDVEAQKRGTSVYFPGQVVPMLPEALSNGLCSLNPHVDRLCMVADMRIDQEGRIKKVDFKQAVMRSHARLTYNNVAKAIVDQDQEMREALVDQLPNLEALQSLYALLHEKRQQRGAIDFETVETRIVFDDNRKIQSIVPVHRNDAHRIIEECMILANVAAARFLGEYHLPALYRVHFGPQGDKLVDLREFLGARGLSLSGGDKPEAKDYAALVVQLADRTDRQIIQTMLLRSLSQAVYTPENEGHFGLALEEYAHFTSPIRRYPDLLVHRAIAHKLSGQSVDSYRYTVAEMEHLGMQSSHCERRADDATRDVMDWLKCEFARDHVGDVFEGVVSAVTGFGAFILLDDVYIEGLVHVTSLPSDYYQFEAVSQALVGKNSGQKLGLGDRVTVRMARVSLEDRKIDLDLLASEKMDMSLKSSASVKKEKGSEAPKAGRRKRRGGGRSSAGKGAGSVAQDHKKSGDSAPKKPKKSGELAPRKKRPRRSKKPKQGD